jgi:hypothetical protein
MVSEQVYSGACFCGGAVPASGELVAMGYTAIPAATGRRARRASRCGNPGRSK